MAATILTDVVRDFLFEQRTREDDQMTGRVAEAVASDLDGLSVDSLNRTLQSNAEAMEGRLMVLDPDGKVQFDTFGTLCGRRLDLEEVLQVLTAGKVEAYGIYTPGRETVERMSGETGAEYLAYCVREIRIGERRLGAILFVSRIQGLMDSMNTVQWKLVTVFMIIVIVALVLALIISQVVTKPIMDLNRTMRKMGKGDLSARAEIRGSGEMRELAQTYNTMAAQLENLDKTRNQFVSNASHELKTPLATMKIMLETLMYQPDMPQELRREFMEDMNHEIDRLTGIITDLLTLTRTDAQAMELKKTSVDLSDLTEEIVRLLSPAAKQRGQTLTCEVEKGLTMMGDRDRLHQVFSNLTDNAIKYTPDGGKIHIALHLDGNELVWRVRDNGVGIPPEDQDHVFERFYRVDKARSRETGGTGLGLSIVRQLVTLHGGTVTVRSDPGQGSEFIVRLPREGA
ncbi:MAG: HAMP domain-containing histidine kinase [Clostridia bacterium]|nr:HAMP domain-containing histidine kinase [Clostridia bacterium]